MRKVLDLVIYSFCVKSKCATDREKKTEHGLTNKASKTSVIINS